LLNTSAKSETLKLDFFSYLKALFNLMKPRVMSLVIFTCVVGLLIAPVKVNFLDAVFSLFAVALGSGAAGALNMWYEADLDSVMTRTCLRPIPTGKVTIKEFGELRSLSFKENTFKTSVTKAPRKTSSRSSSSKSSSSSAAAKKAAEIRASIEKKRAEEAAKRSGGGSERSSRDELRERFANMSDADRQKYAQQMRERFSSQSRGSERSDRGDRGGNSDGRRGRGR